MPGQPEFREQEVPLIVCDFQPIQMAVGAQAGVLTRRDGHRGRPSIFEVDTVYSGLSQRRRTVKSTSMDMNTSSRCSTFMSSDTI